jgi:hypothetical protein
MHVSNTGESNCSVAVSLLLLMLLLLLLLPPPLEVLPTGCILGITAKQFRTFVNSL